MRCTVDLVTHLTSLLSEGCSHLHAHAKRGQASHLWSVGRGVDLPHARSLGWLAGEDLGEAQNSNLVSGLKGQD